MKEKRKSAKRASRPLSLNVAVAICPCNIDNFVEWVAHNIDAISHLFAAKVVQQVINGGQLPALSDFENFCREVHAECLEHHLDKTATRH